MEYTSFHLSLAKFGKTLSRVFACYEESLIADMFDRLFVPFIINQELFIRTTLNLINEGILDLAPVSL